MPAGRIFRRRHDRGTDLPASKIGDPRVIARTSVMAYKNTAKQIDEIGRQLRVGTTLEGSVRKAGNQVRITKHVGA